MVFKETTLLESVASAHLTSETLNAFVLDCLFKDVCIKIAKEERERESVSCGAESKHAYCLLIKKLGCPNLQFLLL